MAQYVFCEGVQQACVIFSTLLLKPQPLRHFWCIMIQHDNVYDLGLICFYIANFQYYNITIGLRALYVINVISTFEKQFFPSFILKRHKTTVVQNGMLQISMQTSTQQFSDFFLLLLQLSNITVRITNIYATVEAYKIRCETNLYWFSLCNRLRMATKRNIKYIVGQHDFRKHMTICNCSSKNIFKLERIRPLTYLLCNAKPFICVYFSFMDLIEISEWMILYLNISQKYLLFTEVNSQIYVMYL